MTIIKLILHVNYYAYSISSTFFVHTQLAKLT